MQQNLPEWETYSDKLAWDVKSIKTDTIMFLFTHINEADWKQEYSFVIDVSEQEYKCEINLTPVVECCPEVAVSASLLNDLNESRDLYLFLKKMRAAFVDHVKRFK